MNRDTKQMQEWSWQFGKEYTDRNFFSPEHLDFLAKEDYGITRSEMNAMFTVGFDRDTKILEVGCNIGSQLIILQKAGFKNLYGIEIQPYAVELSKRRTEGINIIQGSAFDIPFKDGFFDLVFTSYVLMHIAPEDINIALDEIYRCTNKYIWCFEYYAKTYTPINYRGQDDMLWKADFSQLFFDRFADLDLVKEEYFKYLNEDNQDAMFLLAKR